MPVIRIALRILICQRRKCACGPRICDCRSKQPRCSSLLALRSRRISQCAGAPQVPLRVLLRVSSLSVECPVQLSSSFFSAFFSLLQSSFFLLTLRLLLHLLCVCFSSFLLPFSSSFFETSSEAEPVEPKSFELAVGAARRHRGTRPCHAQAFCRRRFRPVCAQREERLGGPVHKRHTHTPKKARHTRGTRGTRGIITRLSREFVNKNKEAKCFFNRGATRVVCHTKEVRVLSDMLRNANTVAGGGACVRGRREGS